MIKAVKVLNVVSVFVFVGILLLVYAFMPISVDLQAFNLISIHKQQFFSYAIGAFCLINGMIRIPLDYIFKNLESTMYAWIMAIVFVLNLYVTFLIGFIGALNNNNSVNPNDFIYLNYLGPVLMVIWIVGLVYLFFGSKKKA